MIIPLEGPPEIASSSGKKVANLPFWNDGLPCPILLVLLIRSKKKKRKRNGWSRGWSIASFHLMFSVIASCSDLLQEQLYLCLFAALGGVSRQPGIWCSDYRDLIVFWTQGAWPGHLPDWRVMQVRALFLKRRNLFVWHISCLSGCREESRQCFGKTIQVS